MIKKLLIALVALSFIVGNVAVADNPPGAHDYSTTYLAPLSGVENPLPVAPLKEPSSETCGWQDYTCSDPWFIYGVDQAGSYGITDVMVRFSPTTIEQCYINQIAFYLYDYGTLAGDVRVTIYREDPAFDNYPDDFAPDGGVITTFVVPNADIVYYPGITYVDASDPYWPAGGVQFPIGEDVFVGIAPESPTDLMVPMGENDLVTCPDGGSCTSEAEQRSLAFFPSAGYHAFVSSCGGTEYANFELFAEICCEEPLYTCPSNQEWPTFQQNNGRTGYSTNTFGDLTDFGKLWMWEGQYYCVYGHPVIANEMVYIAFYDEIVALSIYDGSLVWRTGGRNFPIHPGYEAFLNNTNNNLRTVPTVDGDRIYFGTGRSSLNEGIVCADANTGDTIWVRHSDLGSGLPAAVAGYVGEMQYTTPLVLGDNVYFGSSFGGFYALNKLTGANVWNVVLDQGVMFSPSTDGIGLFVGTSDALAGGGGTLYKLDPATGATMFTYDGYNSGSPDPWGEVFEVAPVYNSEDDLVYVNSGLAISLNTYYTGLLTTVNAADLTPAWGGWNLCYYPVFVTPVVMPVPWNRVTVCGSAGGLGYAYGPYVPGNSSLMTTRNYTLAGSTVWRGDFSTPAGDIRRWDVASNSFAGTCDPYLFAGYGWSSGDWRVLNALTGAVLLDYKFTNPVVGSAVAEYNDVDYAVTAIISSDYSTTGAEGMVFCFSIGPNRPRLHVPELVVTLPSVSFVDSYPQSRFGDLFGNIGSAAMNYTIEILTAKNNMVKSLGAKFVEKAQSDWLAYGTDALNAGTWTGLPNTDKFGVNNASQAAEYVRFPGGTTTASGVLGAGMTLSQEFILDPGLMNRGANPFQVTIDTDDPDYYPELDAPYPHADPQAEITVVAVKGYDFCDGYIFFGSAATNTSYATNAGWMVDNGAPSDGFSIDGEEGFSYHHSFFYGYEQGHIAWNDEAADINGFEPNSLCEETTFSADIYGPTGLDRTITGDRFAASFIDSLKDPITGEFDPNATIGMEMFIKEYGGHDDLFYNFKYIYCELTNRGSDPIPADLYWGTFSDWDVADYGANVGVGMIGDGASAYRMFDNTAPAYQYGVGSVPMKGNLFKDGTPTMGAYGSFQVANDPVVYDGIITDSFFMYIDNCPPYTDCYYPGTEVGVNPGQDMSAILVADKQFVDGDATIKGGVVVFGFNDAASPSADVTGLMNFANKFAGFGRGDVNDDNVINILDLCVLNCYVAGCGCYPYPFLYLGDVNADGNIDQADVDYLFNYLFMGGPMPMGDWVVR